MSENSDLLMNSRDFFKEKVEQAIEHRKIKTYSAVKDYLVNLLEYYLDARNLYTTSEEGNSKQETLAEMLLRALNSDLSVKIELLKKLGDTSLYISGFFGDSLQRKLVDVGYYIDMGGAAYYTLSNCVKEDTSAKVFKEMSFQFCQFMDVLTYISQNSLIQSNESLLRLYDRYLQTGSDLAREKLFEMGVLALPGLSKEQ